MALSRGFYVALAALATLFLLENVAGSARLGVGVGGQEQHKLHPASTQDQPCGKQPDEVCSLPGLEGNPHVRMRSGYITVSEVSDRQLWYLVADREEQQPQRQRGGAGEEPGKEEEATPVLLWLTGGPGCSSLDAFIYEHGPFLFSYSGEVAGKKAEVVLKPNPFSWTKAATVIYVDSPAGAGMSYSGRPEVDYHTNDEYTIADLITFLQGLTERYPELATSPFFIAGESYGGVFVPMLAAELARVNRAQREAGAAPLVNLTGYAVGNPVTDDVIDGNAQMFFAADMGFMDPPTWHSMRKACGDMFWNATPGSDCWEAQSGVKDDLYDLNWYDVLEPCAPVDDQLAAGGARSSSSGSGGRDLAQRFFWPFTARLGSSEQAPAAAQEEGLEAGRRGGRKLWGPWLRHVALCMDRRVSLDWLNREDVRTALHAAPAAGLEWQPCSDVLYYRLDTAELVPLHEKLVREEGLRAMVYSGDHDMVVPHTGTRAWLYGKAKLGGARGPLRPWLMGGQIAGFAARFRDGSAGGLVFATVKGAGHMVPQSRPREMLHLLEAWLYGEEL